MSDGKKMIQVDRITHQMIKELALKSKLTMSAYLMQIAYEEKAKQNQKD